MTGLGLASSGEALRAELGLQPPPLSERLAMNLAPPVSGTPGFYWLAQQKSLAAKTRYIGRKLVPPADFMRFKYPYARKGPGRLTLAYLFRPLWIARWAVPGFLSWQRVRATATASAGPAKVRGRDAILRDGNAILTARMLPWTLLLPALKRVLPLPRLARLMWTEPTTANRNERGRRARSGRRAHARAATAFPRQLPRAEPARLSLPRPRRSGPFARGRHRTR